MSKKDSKIAAFTIAEVLITLGIIGIVAAMTIPALMNNIQDAQFKSAWKKVYSELSQAYSQILNDNGGTITGTFTSVGWVADSNALLTLFGDKLKVMKYCSATSATVFTCFHPLSATSAQAVHDKQGVAKPFSGAPYPAMILGNGMLIHLYGGSPTLYNQGGGIYIYGVIVVDVNGQPGPNIMGRDIFVLWIFANKLYPWGAPNSGYPNTCNTTGNGCAYEYLMQ